MAADAPDAPERDELVEVAVVAAQPCGAAVGRVGDPAKLVLVPACDACGQCDVCRRGGAPVCPHARPRDPRAHTIRVRARWLVELGAGLELPLPAAAAAAGDATLAYTMYARSNLQPRDPAIVLGATPIARFLVEILRAKSIAPIALIPARAPAAWRDWLAARGVASVDEAAPELPAALAAAVAAQGLGARPYRLLVTDVRALPLAASLAGPRATLTALAAGAPPLPAELLAREVAIIGVAGAHPELVVEAAALCAKGEVDLAGAVAADDETGARLV